ncbi:right-handed parallel beta-helix repeat-containing protein [Maribellus maritimus]|uniref:right-handed parallel beta-helix repeat-containing protein n=1 Tax=Maribellus maritimus TaxID=2870838 RepID=UPI001EE9C627|nr:right-handed parallel beta-helix repeat-containing protein [Maribellus maritimus]MCG6188454.1 right-handed parallel beta-helix repeat-containing protein [Maribellus maritimus]
MKVKLYWYNLVLGLFLIFSVSCSNQSEFFISPEGSDLYSGTEAKPFKSLKRAQEAVRIQLKENPGKQIIITVRGGNYSVKEPIMFTAEDSGTEDAPVIYKAADGEEPVFTGSVQLKKWKPLDNVKKLKMFSPEIQVRLFVTDLILEGVTDFGDPIKIGKRPELFCNGKIQTLARWPNTGFVKAGVARGKTELPPHYIKNHGSKEGVFEYLGDRQDQWAEENDVRLGGYWFWDWSDEFQTVDKVDVESHTFYLKEPFHRYGYGDSLRYFGLNLFCEIDQPGEWYLDRLDNHLYWCMPEGVDPKKDEVTLSVFNAPYMVEIRDCSNLKLQGLTFREGRGSAILVSEGKNCLIADCRVERFGQDGIHIDGGSNDGISGCYLSTFGCAGISIKGGDRKTLTPANHFVENTIVSDFSLFHRTYEPAVYVAGCGISLRHNCFQNSSSSAMRLEGNDITVEYNEISHVVNESDDQGGLDMWYNPSYRGTVVQYNYWHDIKGGTVHGAAGVRLDDMISGVKIYGNVFERCGARHFGGVQIHGGKDNLVENNLFYNCLAAVSLSPWKGNRWAEGLESPVIQKKMYNDVDIRSELYQQKYPELKSIRENPNQNTIKNNLVVDCEQVLLKDGGFNIVENNTAINSEGKSATEFCKADILKEYGLEPIPFSEIGLKNNKWIN